MSLSESEFYDYLLSLNSRQLHALWMMERARLSDKEQEMIRAEAKRRLDALKPMFEEFERPEDEFDDQ